VEVGGFGKITVPVVLEGYMEDYASNE
jgi:hypothetical protein